MGMSDYNSDFGCTPMEYRGQIDSLIGALGLIGSPSDLPGCDVIRLATQFIYDAQQRPSRREIAARAMQGLLGNASIVACKASYAELFETLSEMAEKSADALIERLSVDLAEGANNGK